MSKWAQLICSTKSVFNANNLLYASGTKKVDSSNIPPSLTKTKHRYLLNIPVTAIIQYNLDFISVKVLPCAGKSIFFSESVCNQLFIDAVELK